MPLFRRQPADAVDLERRIEQADDALEENDPRTALRIADGVLKDAGRGSPEAVSAQVVRAEAFRAMERFVDAGKAAARACEWDPEDGAAWHERALAAYRMARFDDAAAWLEEAVHLEPEEAHAWNALGRVRIWLDEKDAAKDAFKRAAGLDPTHFVVPLRIAAFEFDRIAGEVWKQIPRQFKERMDNTIVAVEELPDEEDVEDGTDPDLLGLYTGATALGDDFPERILLFQRNHENSCATLGDLAEEIRRTILHEVGHHFGMDHDELPLLMRLFAETAEAIAATTSKLEKVRLLAGYLRSLDDQRVGVAARFFSGLIFPTWDMRVLSLGGAALWGVLQELTGATAEEMSTAWARHGDAGGAAHDVLLRVSASAPGVDVLDVVQTFEDIASAPSTAARAALLDGLLRRCTPLEAKYVVKLITGEMRIGLREGLVEEAIAAAFGRDKAAVSRADMVIGDLGEVALLARQDRLDEAAPRLFAPMRFMLASPVADAAEVVQRMGEEVWVEDKYDGIRCQVHRDDSRVMLFSRDLKDVTAQFPEVAEAVAALPGILLLDGEVLAFKDGRVMPFAALQTRLGRKTPALAVTQRVPVIFVAWDVLYQDGLSLLDEPLRERRKRLDALQLGGALATAHQEHARGAAAVDVLFDNARERLNEGLIAKDPDSPYTPGRRGLSWLKLKKPLDTLDVVVTGAELGHGKRRDVLSDVTFSVRVDDSEELVPIGKAYTGLTDAEIAEMTELLTSITVSEHGRFRVVRPEIVLEVAFDRVQPSARHRSGYALRFPRIARWRHDKPVAEIDTLSRVAALARTADGERLQLVDRA